MSLTLAEQETIIRFDRESDMASIYTHERSLMAMLEKRGFKPTLQNVYGGRVVAKAFNIPKTWVAVRPKAKRSEAQREAARRNVARLHGQRETLAESHVSLADAAITGSNGTAIRLDEEGPE